MSSSYDSDSLESTDSLYLEFRHMPEYTGKREKLDYAGEQLEDVFDNLTDAQVLDLMAEVETEARHWELENHVFWWFLEDNDPNLLQDVPGMIEKAMLLKFGNIVELQSQTRVRSSKVSFGSVASILEGRTININLVQKSDMVLKATEVKHAALQKFLKRSHITRRNTLSELEEFRIREVDITLAQKIFEHRVILEGVDSLTQRIPAEKFLKYMHDWLRAASSDIEKLRLRTTHMKLQYKKACSVLEVRQELAKTLHAVDLDRLVIENRRLSKEYETKMIFLMETKKRAGATSRLLNCHKQYLMNLQKKQKEIRKQLAEVFESTKMIEKECVLVEDEVTRAEKEHSEFLYIAEHYRVPDVMVYVNLKKEYANVQHETKIWRRKKNVLDISLRAAIKEMMHLTGAKEVNNKWLEEPREPAFIDKATFSKLIDPQKLKVKGSDHEAQNELNLSRKSNRTISLMTRLMNSKSHLSQSSLDPSELARSFFKGAYSQKSY